jgi:hypothetical protein
MDLTTDRVLEIAGELSSTELSFEESESDYGEVRDGRLILTSSWYSLDPIRQLYVVLHEVAHLRSPEGHNEVFYQVLEELVIQYLIPWDIAREIEQVYPQSWKSK